MEEGNSKQKLVIEIGNGIRLEPELNPGEYEFKHPEYSVRVAVEERHRYRVDDNDD